MSNCIKVLYNFLDPKLHRTRSGRCGFNRMVPMITRKEQSMQVTHIILPQNKISFDHFVARMVSFYNLKFFTNTNHAECRSWKSPFPSKSLLWGENVVISIAVYWRGLFRICTGRKMPLDETLDLHCKLFFKLCFLVI